MGKSDRVRTVNKNDGDTTVHVTREQFRKLKKIAKANEQTMRVVVRNVLEIGLKGFTSRTGMEL